MALGAAETLSNAPFPTRVEAGLHCESRSSGANLENMKTVQEGSLTVVPALEKRPTQLPVPASQLGAANADQTSMTIPEGHPVTRLPEQLRLHPAIEAVGWDSLLGSLTMLFSPKMRLCRFQF